MRHVRSNTILSPNSKNLKFSIDRGNYAYYCFAVFDHNHENEQDIKYYVDEYTTRICHIKRWLVDAVCMEVVGKTLDDLLKEKGVVGHLVGQMNEIATTVTNV